MNFFWFCLWRNQIFLWFKICTYDICHLVLLLWYGFSISVFALKRCLNIAWKILKMKDCCLNLKWLKIWKNVFQWKLWNFCFKNVGNFLRMKLLLFKIILLSNLIMLFVIQSYETLLVILRNFVDNICISYLFPKLLG